VYWTYLRRELSGRKKQTIIVAIGLAIAIALVVLVTSLSAGIRDAQAQALASVYGVGTDLTVTGAQTEPSAGGRGGPRFDVGAGEGTASGDGSTTVTQSRLVADTRRGSLPTSALTTVTGIDGVAAASGTLSLTNLTFSGQLSGTRGEGGQNAQGGEGQNGEGQSGEGSTRPDGGGGQGGFGGGSFGVDSITVLGVDPAASTVGPLSAAAVTTGRALSTDDESANVAVVDASYASSAGLSVGGTVELGGTAFEVVGIVASTTSSADTAANVYIPLDVAQTLSGAGDVLSTIYVQAASSDRTADVQTAITAALQDATVSSSSELASGVSGSLSTASSLITALGTWLSILMLVLAAALAVLFTISGVARRTRELGTLKAIGWSRSRVVGQIAGESVVQALIGGIAGVALGLVGVLIVNLVAPTLTSRVGGAGGQGGLAGQGGPGGRDGGFGGRLAGSANDVILHAPVSVWIIVVALLLAIAAGVIAGAVGGWRAARLSPAEALRTVA